MLVNDCKKCKYSKINQDIKDIYMYINQGTTPWFNICKATKFNGDKNIYCFTSALNIDLSIATQTYQKILEEDTHD